MKIDYKKATFMTSAAKLEQLPADEGIEVAFAGRSNAGKSSALNVLTGQKGLAKTSKTPGRTQLINLFQLDEKRRLVDLPGYGYAKVPQAIKERWEKTLERYLEERACLQGLILLMDIRHPLKTFDFHMLDWAQACELPVHILLTKSDKLSRSAALTTLHEVQKSLSDFSQTSIQLFSAMNKMGIDDLKSALNIWYSKL